MALQTRIFVDFWNFQLSINDHTNDQYRVDWTLVSPWLMNEAEGLIGQSLSFEGTTIYISYNEHTQAGRNLKNFASNTLNSFPGISVNIVKRRPRNPPICSSCHQQIINCPHCNEVIKRTIEKGVDTAIVTDMFRLAWESSLDVAILVSSDRDFIPLVNTLASKGYKVINAHFPPQGMNLAKECWASIDIKTGINSIER